MGDTDRPGPHWIEYTVIVIIPRVARLAPGASELHFIDGRVCSALWLTFVRVIEFHIVT
jgi:hypothetical protein